MMPGETDMSGYHTQLPMRGLEKYEYYNSANS